LSKFFPLFPAIFRTKGKGRRLKRGSFFVEHTHVKTVWGDFSTFSSSQERKEKKEDDSLTFEWGKSYKNKGVRELLHPLSAALSEAITL